MYDDKILTCVDCGTGFTWTSGEQEFFAEKGFDTPPTRCQDCRKAKKAAIRSSRSMHETECAQCGKACQVPFKPKGDRPVYCSDCYEEINGKKD